MAVVEYPLAFSLSALIAMAPSALAAYRPGAARDATFWATLAAAIAGPAAWSAAQLSGAWQTGLSTALWITVTTCLVVYAVLAATTRDTWRLTPLLAPYLILLGIIATIWEQAPGQPLSAGAPLVWVEAHIVFSILTYAILTLAAVAGVAVFLQERALKTKRPTRLTTLLPSVADAEIIQVRLLFAGGVVLGLGLLTGAATQLLETGSLLVFNHKTLLSIGAFLVIAGLLVAHFRTGIRGRRAARYVLLAYLLVTLGYPGVKFVTDVLLG